MIVKQLDYDLTPVAGLSLVGHLLKSIWPVFRRVDAALPIKGGVANSDIVRSYLGLLTQGKSDFDAIEAYRGDAFFKQALEIGLLPSSPTLRQRMDARAAELFDFVPAMIESLLGAQRPDFGRVAVRLAAAGRGHVRDGQQRHGQGGRGAHLRWRGRLLSAGGVLG